MSYPCTPDIVVASALPLTDAKDGTFASFERQMFWTTFALAETHRPLSAVAATDAIPCPHVPPSADAKSRLSITTSTSHAFFPDFAFPRAV